MAAVDGSWGRAGGGSIGAFSRFSEETAWVRGWLAEPDFRRTMRIRKKICGFDDLSSVRQELLCQPEFQTSFLLSGDLHEANPEISAGVVPCHFRLRFHSSLRSGSANEIWRELEVSTGFSV